MRILVPLFLMIIAGSCNAQKDKELANENQPMNTKDQYIKNHRNLNDDFKKMESTVLEKHPEFSKFLLKEEKSLAEETANALQTGDSFPLVQLAQLLSAEGNELTNELSKGYVLISWTRSTQHPYSRLAMKNLVRYYLDFKKIGVPILIFGVEQKKVLEEFAEENGLAGVLRSDSKNILAEACGLADHVNSESMSAEEKILDFSYGPVRSAGLTSLPISATYLLDSTGSIVWSHIPTNYGFQADFREVLQTTARIKFKVADGQFSAYNPLNNFETWVIEQKGTERAYTGEYWNEKANGIYVCRKCNNPLYVSSDKFDSHCGWPSFDDEISHSVVRKLDADGYRTEILCANCGGHLGHVFEGERFTEKDTRHCVNSVSVRFIPNQ